MSLREWLQQNNITKSQFARTIGVSRATVHHILTGQHCPTLAVAIKIQAITEIEPHRLYIDFKELQDE